MKFERGIDPRKTMGIGVRHESTVVVSLYGRGGIKITGKKAHEVFRQIERRDHRQPDAYIVEVLTNVGGKPVMTEEYTIGRLRGKLLRFGGTYYKIPG